MKITTPLMLFAGAAAILVVSKTTGLDDVAFGTLSLLIGGVGVGTLFPALKERWSSQGLESTRFTLLEMEKRLRLTEDELAAATSELTALREKQDFDLSLQVSAASVAQQTLVDKPVGDTALERGV